MKAEHSDFIKYTKKIRLDYLNEWYDYLNDWNNHLNEWYNLYEWYMIIYMNGIINYDYLYEWYNHLNEWFNHLI